MSFLFRYKTQFFPVQYYEYELIELFLVTLSMQRPPHQIQSSIGSHADC